MKKPVLICLVICLFFSSFVFASSETLPKGVWMFSMESTYYSVAEVAVETVSLGVGQGDFHYVEKSEFTADKIPSLYPLVAQGLLPGSIQLADSYVRTDYTFSINYGVLPNLTIGLSIPYIQKTLQYNEAFINELTTTKQQISLISSELSDDIVIPPSTAKAAGFGDGTFSVLYKVLEDTALAFTYKGGLLGFGTDPTEVTPARDGFEELNTGDKAHYYTFAGFYDSTYIYPVGFMAAYTYSTDGYERVFDNDFATNDGDTITLVAESTYKINEEFRVDGNGVFQYAFTDQKYDGDTLTDIDNTEVYALVAGLKLHYQPTIFFDSWISYNIPLYNKAAGGVYDFPGRLNTDAVITFGATVFYK